MDSLSCGSIDWHQFTCRFYLLDLDYMHPVRINTSKHSLTPLCPWKTKILPAAHVTMDGSKCVDDVTFTAMMRTTYRTSHWNDVHSPQCANRQKKKWILSLKSMNLLTSVISSLLYLFPQTTKTRLTPKKINHHSSFKRKQTPISAPNCCSHIFTAILMSYFYIFYDSLCNSNNTVVFKIRQAVK